MTMLKCVWGSMAKGVLETEGQTIILQGNVEHPTEDDMERVQKIRDELDSKHEGGLIVHRTNKRSNYRQLTIEY